MFWNDGGSWGAGQWIAMSLGMLLFFGLVAVAIYFIVHSLQDDRSRNQWAPPTATADQLLAERFARGEIDADEYAARRAVLHGTSTSTKKDLSHT
jgi:putative membrane protein